MHRTPLALVALAALALPASAAAQANDKTVDYEVTILGNTSYNRADVDTETTAQHDLAVDFKTVIPKVQFDGRVVADSTGALGQASVSGGHYAIHGSSTSVHCAEQSIADVTGGGFDASFNEDRTVFATRVIDAFTVDVHCPSPMGTWQLPFTSGGEEVGVGMFDGSFSLPHSRIGEAEMVFPLKGEVTGAECPMHHSRTASCTLQWDAEVRFVKTGEGTSEAKEVEPVPLTPAPQSPAPQAPTPPANDPQLPPSGPDAGTRVSDDPLLVPLVAKARLSRDLRTAGLPISCATACRGTITATARGKALATRAFTAKAGRTARPQLRFDAADRRAIRRAGAVTLTVKGKAGPQELSRSVRLRTGR